MSPISGSAEGVLPGGEGGEAAAGDLAQPPDDTVKVRRDPWKRISYSLPGSAGVEDGRPASGAASPQTMADLVGRLGDVSGDSPSTEGNSDGAG